MYHGSSTDTLINLFPPLRFFAIFLFWLAKKVKDATKLISDMVRSCWGQVSFMVVQMSKNYLKNNYIFRGKNMNVFNKNCIFSQVKPHTSNIRMTCEWHADDIRVHTSEIRMIYEYKRVTHEYIPVTYSWHTSTYKWYKDDMSTYERYTDDIREHTVLGYLPNLKRSLELCFRAHFLHGVFIQIFLI